MSRATRARVALAACAVGLCAARSAVWSATAGAGTLQVFDDDSYTLLLGSDPWLESGPTSVHVNGVWYSTAVSSESPGCRDFPDTDCHGNDLFFFNSTSPADCCANCSATPGCGAWTYTGTTRDAAPPPWALRCYIKSSCDGREAYVGHTSGLPAGSGGAPLPLTRVSAGGVGKGGWGITYAAASPNASTVTFSVTFAVENGGFVFEQAWPQGAPGVNITTPVNSTSVTEFDSSTEPATQFPVFIEANSSVSASLGYLSWAGRFFPTLGATRVGAAAAFSAAAGGAESGPIVLFDGPVNALVMSAHANFKSHMIGQSSIAPTAAAAGISGYVTSLPPAFTTSTVVTAGSAGITDAVHAWGNVLQRRYNTAKIPDPASTALSYWTDNGGYYDWYAYEPNITSKGVPQDVLVALSETFKNGTYGSLPLPVRAWMLDAYWYWNTRANANCAMNLTTWPLPFPDGLETLSQALEAPLIMYGGPICGNTTLAEAWTIEPSLYWDLGWGAGVLGIVTSEESNAFYTDLMASLLAQGMLSFTQDFLDFQGLLFPTTLVDPIGNAGWMKGQADAALAAGVAVQYCMGLPADMLASVAFNAVTNARASNDYGAGGDNWKIGGSSLLLSALGMRASKDNFWTSCCNDRGGETSPYLVAIVSTLSGGPVGFADALFATDAAVLWPTMALNGTLLHASRPATAINAQFVGGSPLSSGDVRAAHSAVATTGSSSPVLLFHTILTAELPASVSLPLVLTATDLWPLPTASELLVWQFNASACAVAGPASSCVSPVGGARSAAPATPSADKVAWELYFVSPVLAGGYALLGEVGKYVAVSPDRFALVAAAEPFGVHVELVGAPNEVITLSYVVPGGSDPLGTTAVKSLTLGSDGRIAADLT